MVKLIELGTSRSDLKRIFYKIRCMYCSSVLAFPETEAWVEDPANNIARIECPNCRRKVFFTMQIPVAAPDKLQKISQDDYEHAHSDMSKSGLQMLMDEKKVKDNA